MQYLLHHWLESNAISPTGRDTEAFRDAQGGISYAAANRMANQLAASLAADGVTHGDRVALFMERSVEACIAIFAILKLGAAYVPIDPKSPHTRVTQIATTVGASAVIVDPPRATALTKITLPASVRCVIGDAENPWETIAERPDTPVSSPATDDDLAYVIFTSGSTGTPKGIMHTHRSGLAYARWAASAYGLERADRVASFSPFHFDISTFDLFAARLAGATTVIVPQGLQMFPQECAKLLEQEQISVVFSVPHAFQLLADRGCLSERDLHRMRWMIYGGEPYAADAVRKLMSLIPSTNISNMYGPAEVNGVTCYHLSTPPPGDSPVPIGPPAANVSAILLDTSGHEVTGPGEGELAIRSSTQMIGYWNAEPPQQSYLHTSTAPGGRRLEFYRTGDIVSRDASGCFTFRGRRDHLVKVRGHRIELGEVEFAINACHGVAYTACAVLGDLLVATVEPIAGHELSENAVLSALKLTLPPYAIPSKVAVTEKIPRTTTGKIDRTRLHELFA